MAAALDDATAVEHDDLVGMDDGRQPVGDHQGGAAAAHLFQRALDLLLGARVERAGRLVEQQDMGVLQDGAGDRHALLLAARELQAALADRRLVALRQGHDEVMDARQPGRPLDILARAVGPAVADVVVDRVVEQHRVLRHHADRGPQAVLRHLTDILAIDPHAAGGHVVEAEQDARHRRLAGPARPHDRHGVARCHAEIDVVQDRPRLLVVEVDMVEHDLAAAHLQRRGAWLVGDLGRDGEQAEHALHVDQRIADLAIGEAQHVERHVELDQEGVHRHEVADRHGAGLYAVARHDHHHDQAGRDDDALADIEHRQGAAGTDRGLLVAPPANVEAAGLVRLVAEILHRLVVQQAVDRLGIGVRVGIVHRAHELDAPFRQADREHDIACDRHQGHGREAPVVEAPHHDTDQQDLEQGRQDVEGGEADQEFHAGRAALDDAAEPTGLTLEMEAQGQGMQMAEDLQGEAADRPLRDRREQRIAQLAERLGRDPGHAIGQDERDGHRDRLHLGIAQGIDGVLVDDRHVDVGDLGRDQQYPGHDHAAAQADLAFRPQIAADDAQNRPGPLGSHLVGGSVGRAHGLKMPCFDAEVRWRRQRGPSIVPRRSG